MTRAMFRTIFWGVAVSLVFLGIHGPAGSSYDGFDAYRAGGVVEWARWARATWTDHEGYKNNQAIDPAEVATGTDEWVIACARASTTDDTGAAKALRLFRPGPIRVNVFGTEGRGDSNKNEIATVLRWVAAVTGRDIAAAYVPGAAPAFTSTPFNSGADLDIIVTEGVANQSRVQSRGGWIEHAEAWFEPNSPRLAWEEIIQAFGPQSDWGPMGALLGTDVSIARATNYDRWCLASVFDAPSSLAGADTQRFADWLFANPHR